MIFGFFVYLGCCLVFFVLAAYAFASHEPVGIWANEHRPKSKGISDVKAYNRAVGKLFLGYGIALLLCGLPMILDAHIVVLMLVSVLGVVLSSIVLVVLAVKIDQKYSGRH